MGNGGSKFYLYKKNKKKNWHRIRSMLLSSLPLRGGVPVWEDRWWLKSESRKPRKRSGKGLCREPWLFGRLVGVRFIVSRSISQFMMIEWVDRTWNVNKALLVVQTARGVMVFHGEFDPGSGLTLAACLTHASRTGSFLVAILRMS